jgi:hypothetical protein
MDRVKKGIETLDRHLEGWRSKLNIPVLRFADPDKGPLGQLFGSYSKGLYKTKVICRGQEMGFCAYPRPGDANNLKAAWVKALETDRKWRKINNALTKKILGVRFTLYESDNKVHIMMSRPGWAKVLDGSYTTYDSAKRAVRKISRKI